MKVIFSTLALSAGIIALGLGSVAIAQTSYYYAGQADSGQQLIIDLDSISSAGNSDANFNYLLGDELIVSQAHCVGAAAWTTLTDGVVHYPQSQAARDMVRIVCSYLNESVSVAAASSDPPFLPLSPISAAPISAPVPVAITDRGNNPIVGNSVSNNFINNNPVNNNSINNNSVNSNPDAVQTALVYDPSSNVRETPNGYVLCSIDTRAYINIYGHYMDDWYSTDACGSLGVIHISQIQF
ncbi:MAG: hypothetical protein WBG63_00575 [Phormidesmis sp.]